MAERDFTQFQYSLEKGLVELVARVSVGAAGAVTLKKWNPSTRTYSAAATTGVGSYAVGSQGIRSVARTGTGAWTITLQDKYQRLVSIRAMTTAASGVATVGGLGIDSTSDVTATTPVIKVVLYSTPGTPADPASGDEVDLVIRLQNSAAL